MSEQPKRRRSGLNIAGRLIGLVRPMLPVMLAAILMGVAGFSCAIFITVLGGYALLAVLGLPGPFGLSFIFAAVLVMALLRGVLRYAEQAANHYIAFKLLALIRDKIFKALRRLAPAKLETRDKGNLISVITTDIELMEVFYAHTISPVAIAFVVSLGMTVFIASFHPLLGMIALIAYLTVGLLIPSLISQLGREAGMAYREQSGRLGSLVLDSLRGLGEILQYGQGTAKLTEIRRRTKELGEKEERMKRYEGLTVALSNTAILVFSLTVFFAGIVLYLNGAVNFLGVVIPFIAMISSFGPVVALANLANNLLSTFAAADRVLDILDESPQTLEILDGRSVSFDGMTCQDVNFAYDEEEILRDVNLDFPQGEILGIQGKSGSGKSTLLRLLMRFWDVDGGSVTMSGQDVRGINTASLRANQSFITQETVLFNESIAANVRVAKLAATQAEVEAACQKAAIHDFIMTLPAGYDTNVGELGDSLSGGERQRLGLARAFLHDAPLILLDEPTSNLDSLNEGLVLKSLAAERADKTLVMVSHRASSLGIADEIIRMDEGRCS